VRTITTVFGEGGWFSTREVWAPEGVSDEETWKQSDGSEPTELRVYSIAELRRLSSFPDDFKLTGDFKRQWERLARAVPPKMMVVIGLGSKSRSRLGSLLLSKRV
jgi:site-specific DNA-cytosine methylase